MANALALLGLSVPSFWLGLIAILYLAVATGLFPASGFVPLLQDPVENLHHIILPAVILGTGLAAVIMRQTRSSMLESLSTDYVRTARAKGLRSGVVVGRHALRNSLIVVVTIVGLQLGGLISGAVVTEQIFGLPGFGKMTDRRGVPARLPGDPGRRADHGHRVHRHQLPGRPALLADRPAHPRGRGGSMTATQAPTRRPPSRHRREAGRQSRVHPAAAPQPAGRAQLRGPADRRRSSPSSRPWLAPYAPEQTDFANTFAPPGTPGHLLGTDDLGRDVLSRIILGAAGLAGGRRCSPSPRRCSSGCRSAWPAGYFRAADAVISRFTDLLLAFPFLILAVGLAAIRGASLGNAAVAIGIAQIPGVIRVVRSDTLRLKSLDFVAAAVVDGASDLWVLAGTSCPTPPR